jgi:hypothetical protein
MGKQPVGYLSYLLRLWRTGETRPWKASLEDPQTGQRLGFKSLDALFKFLCEETASNCDPGDTF